MNDVVNLLLGAALVVIGVVVAALADRIRGVRSSRESAPRAAASAKAVASRDTSIAANDIVRQEVVGALVAAGYPKRVAGAATAGCAPEQRTSAESWTRAALRTLSAGGGMT